MNFKLYTLDNKFIEEILYIPPKFVFTGIVKDGNHSKEWFLNGKYHRLDGPAIEWASGKKEWYLNDIRHRIDGPAVEWPDGSKEWLTDGKRHRLDGPAIEWFNGEKYWWVNNKQVTELQCKLLYDLIKLKGLHV